MALEIESEEFLEAMFLPLMTVEMFWVLVRDGDEYVG